MPEKIKALLSRFLKPNSKKEAVFLLCGLFLFSAYNAYKMYKTCPWRQHKEANLHYSLLLSDSEWLSLTHELERRVKSFPAKAGVVLKDFETGRVWQADSSGKFRSASLIKLPIAAAVIEKLGDGEISLAKSLSVSRKNRVSGSGTLRWENNGTAISLEKALFKMITESDNTAAKMIMDEIGLDSISTSLRALGLRDTNVCSNISNLTGRKIKDDSFTTPGDIAWLLEKIYDGSLVDRKYSNYLLSILKQTKGRSRLRAGLPEGWELAHKTGLLRKACHDAGIVFSPRGDYLLVVMTGNVPNYRKAKSFVASVGRITYKYYRPQEPAVETI